MRSFDSIDSKIKHNNWDVKYSGPDYSDNLLKNSVSLYLYNNMKANKLLDFINSLLVNSLDSVKYIRIFNNIAVPEEYKKIN